MPPFIWIEEGDSLSFIEHIILDEADQMIDLGFYQPIKRICASVSKPCQTIFFSATMPAEMKSLSDEFLHDKVTIKIESKNITADTVSQRAIMVSDALKRETLGKLLEDVDGDQVLVFVGTKRRADALGQFLSAQDIRADVLHGDMRQNIRSKFAKIQIRAVASAGRHRCRSQRDRCGRPKLGDQL